MESLSVTYKLAPLLAVIALALPATAQAGLYSREHRAVSVYAAAQHGAVTGCRIYGHHRREVRCRVSVALVLEPSGQLIGYDQATICAFRDEGAIYLARVSPWVTVAPGLVPV